MFVSATRFLRDADHARSGVGLALDRGTIEVAEKRAVGRIALPGLAAVLVYGGT